MLISQMDGKWNKVLIRTKKLVTSLKKESACPNSYQNDTYDRLRVIHTFVSQLRDPHSTRRTEKVRGEMVAGGR